MKNLPYTSLFNLVQAFAFKLGSLPSPEAMSAPLTLFHFILNVSPQKAKFMLAFLMANQKLNYIWHVYIAFLPNGF